VRQPDLPLFLDAATRLARDLLEDARVRGVLLLTADATEKPTFGRNRLDVDATRHAQSLCILLIVRNS